MHAFICMQGLALNNTQGLISLKTQPNKTINTYKKDY